MLTVMTLLKVKPSPDGHLHGERSFWAERGQQYLDAWLEGVDRYVPKPHQVLVMTDDERLLAMQVDDRAEYFPIGRIVDAPGFWAKLEMFRYAPGGRCLWLDLDNRIIAPLDALCALNPDPLIMLDDRHVPRLPNGSAILFDAERCREIWDAYVFAKRTYERYYVAKGDDYSLAYDQAFIADWYRTQFGRPVPFFQDLLPEGYCLNAFSELPKSEDWRDAHLIFGCGAAKPHTSKHPAFAFPE